MFRKLMVAMAAVLGFASLVCAGAAERLTVAQAQELVLNTPSVLAVKAKHGCPHVGEPSSLDGKNLNFQVRDLCDRSGATSTLIDVFTVDPSTGDVWPGYERGTKAGVIKSPRLSELQRKFLTGKK
jgi:hypothetical protein